MSEAQENLSNLQMVELTIAHYFKQQPLMIPQLVPSLKMVMPTLQLRSIMSIIYDPDAENEDFRATMLSYIDTFKRLNATYQALPEYGTTANIPIPERIAYLHYFAGGSDWWLLEKDTEEQDQNLAFGVIALHQQYPETGSISLDELVASPYVSLDEHFQPKTIKDIRELSDLCNQ
ncbi:DUF2958 domain-containing protein [Zophobihabitans entericus]|uniref:DUF2958 domain-containing protein n=1 Tax=Zophobihabitans entericus TaxID=1635327 RepID=A0A6G9IEN2_9GAMM|nr:DUF2958 domain-containing protein [Zophobihabitans entericus]QIQ22154.1 DUF2958 domain-containing protein [Zophobihabitans entericus]